MFLLELEQQVSLKTLKLHLTLQKYHKTLADVEVFDKAPFISSLFYFL